MFTGVTISDATANVSTDYVDFIGTYSPTLIYEDGAEKHNLYLGSGNTLYYPSRTGYSVNACRAYFRLNGITAGDAQQQARAFVLNFGDGTTSLSEELRVKSEEFLSPEGESVARNATAAGWYTLDGRKLNGKPTAKGMYIVNGKKVVIK